MPYLKYQSVVSIFSSKSGHFLTAEKDGSTSLTRDKDKQWEKFLLLDPQNMQSTEEIKSGDEIALLSYHNYYMVCEQDGIINANREELNSWEKFTVYRLNDADSLGDKFPIHQPSKFALLSLKSHTGKFLTPDSSNNLKASLDNIDSSPFSLVHNTALSFHLHEWTDFHYGISLGDPRCSDRGRYDGANCFIALPPEGKPFIYNNNFYYTSNNTNPILGWHDSANVQVGSNHIDSHPFIHGGSFYLKQSITAPSTGSNALGYASATGQNRSIKVCAYPKENNYNPSNGQLIGVSHIDLSSIEYFKACYKRKWSFRNVCHKSIYWSGSNCSTIPNLRGGKKYKVKVFFKKVGGSEQYLDTISSVRTQS